MGDNTLTLFSICTGVMFSKFFRKADTTLLGTLLRVGKSLMVVDLPV